MKKALAAGIVLLLAALGSIVLMGSGPGDPLISLSYLKGKFAEDIDAAENIKLDESDEAMRAQLEQKLDQMRASAEALAGQNIAREPTEALLNQGDVLTGATGLIVTPLAGTVRVEMSTGAVIDITAGEEIPSGSVLDPNHRYVVAEAAVAGFSVQSPAAVVRYQGSYSFSRGMSPDYWAISKSLRDLGLFRGTGVAYGEGFDLHLAPNRGQGIVMFIRLLGEENEALACTGEHPFTDVPGWLDRYVAWAWEKGYSNGVGEHQFGTQLTISAQEYTEFILRALGLSTIGVDDYRTSLERAYEGGMLTGGEYQMLKFENFLRAHVAYLSYYSLDAVSSDGTTLSQHLIGKNVFTSGQLSQAKAQVKSERVG